MSWWHTALDLLLPDTCVLCKQSQAQRHPHLLCHVCWASLPRNVHACPGCATPQPSPGKCAACLRAPLTADVCLAALKHEGDARLLIHQLKYAHNLRAGAPLAQALCEAVTVCYQTDCLPEVLVPVPLSFRRQVARGYNQAAWLAYRVGQHLQLSLLYGAIKRRHGPPQQSLTRGQRLRLSNTSFAMSAPLAQAHVAIVDDVLTTGATVLALSNLLRAAGAERVDIWCASRATLD